MKGLEEEQNILTEKIQITYLLQFEKVNTEKNLRQH